LHVKVDQTNYLEYTVKVSITRNYYTTNIDVCALLVIRCRIVPAMRCNQT